MAQFKVVMFLNDGWNIFKEDEIKAQLIILIEDHIGTNVRIVEITKVEKEDEDKE